MIPDIKFCGLTRPVDVVHARSLGARYLGFVFAASARQLTVEQAAALLQALTAAGEDTHAPSHALATEPWRVGVFAGATADEVARTAELLALDVVQLHGVGETTLLSALRGRTDAEIWSVLHVSPAGVEEQSLHAALLADAVLLDARSDQALGGTGRTFDWDATAALLEPYRSTRRFVLAGGLAPDNVARAIAAMAPDVVDVSSGVERSPGHKDHARMRAFADAVHGALPR